MFQLILTIISIALTVAMLTASINYIPWWHKTANDTEETMRRSLRQVEQAYDVATRAANGEAPAVQGSADGGFSANFQPVLKLLPAAPPGFTWRYGKNSATEGTWAGLNWFCLEYTADEDGASQGSWKGAQRVQALYSADQLTLSGSCGSTSQGPAPSDFPAPLAVTLYVAYVPGLTP